MPTTSIRLTDELKERLAGAAERTGSTPHAFILEAIAEKAEAVERSSEFRDEAERRYETIVATGRTVPWDEMRAYLIGRVRGAPVRRPRAKKLSG